MLRSRKAKNSQGRTPAHASRAPRGNSSRYGSRRSTAPPTQATARLTREDEVEELRAAGDAELRIDLRQMLFDGLLAVAHHRADLGRGEPLEDQAGDLLFLARQPRLGERAVYEAREVDVDRGHLVEDLPQRLGCEGLLEQVRGARIQRRLHALGIGE